jgi:hypothetical protein
MSASVGNSVAYVLDPNIAAFRPPQLREHGPERPDVTLRSWIAFRIADQHTEQPYPARLRVAVMCSACLSPNTAPTDLTNAAATQKVLAKAAPSTQDP